MKLALFVMLLSIPTVCGVHVIENLLARNLRYGFCSPVIMQPTWLFQRFIKQYDLPVAAGTNVSVDCTEGTPVLVITCDEGLYLSDGSQSKNIICLDETCPDFENCTAIVCDQVTINNANVTMLPQSDYLDTVGISCNAGYILQDGSDLYTAECQLDGQWSSMESCIVDGTSSGYTYSPRTGKFYKYVKPASDIVYSGAEATCTSDNANAVVAPPPEADIIWLLNITVSGTTRNGGWVEAQKTDSASPWLLSDDTIIPTYYWCVNQPQYPGTAPWCIYVNSCWFPRPCAWGREAVICQLG